MAKDWRYVKNPFFAKNLNLIFQREPEELHKYAVDMFEAKKPLKAYGAFRILSERVPGQLEVRLIRLSTCSTRTSL